MSTLTRIALNVFKESVRDKVFYNLVLFATILIASSYLLGQLTAGQEVKIIKDLGLAATSIFGVFIAIFIGIGLVSKEIERRTIYSLLAKPIRRYEFILGKFAGLVLTLAVNVSVMTAALYVVLAIMGWNTPAHLKAVWEAPAVDAALLKAICLIFTELVVLTAAALFFSTFSSPILAATLSFALFIVGHFNADLRHFENVVESPVAIFLARTVFYVLPNLAPFDVKTEVVHAIPVSAEYLLATVAYGALYTAALLVGSIWIFERRNFK